MLILSADYADFTDSEQRPKQGDGVVETYLLNLCNLLINIDCVGRLNERYLRSDVLGKRQIGPEGVEKAIEVGALTQPAIFPGESVFAWEIIQFE